MLVRIAALALIAASFAGAQVTYTISGTVTREVNPTTQIPVPGVTMTLGGAQNRTTTTNALGQYAFTALPAGGFYTITPSSPGYHFGPFTGIVTSLARDVTADFEAIPNTGATLVLDRTQLRFGATTGGAFITGPQQVQVNLIGTTANTTAWTATSSQPWLTVSPAGGTGSGRFTVSINQNALPAGIGTTNGTITVMASNATGSPQTVAVALNTMFASSTATPIGVVDTPANLATNLQGAIGVTGWALDDIEVVRISVWRDRIGNEPVYPNGLVYIIDGVFLEGARPDVANAFPSYPLNTRAGWGVQILTNMLINSNGSPGLGNGTYKFSVFAHDREGKTKLLGAPTVTVNNAASTQPFGTLDTPGNGETISGSQYTVFGWALTPQPGTIPTNGSTIAVFVDGVSLGSPVYNNFRPDIAMLFPGYNNSNGAIGYFYLDTTTLSNGLHSIAWSVTDNLGRTTGIGSRLFWVRN
jgi:hypothetical protein